MQFRVVGPLLMGVLLMSLAACDSGPTGPGPVPTPTPEPASAEFGMIQVTQWVSPMDTLVEPDASGNFHCPSLDCKVWVSVITAGVAGRYVKVEIPSSSVLKPSEHTMPEEQTFPPPFSILTVQLDRTKLQMTERLPLDIVLTETSASGALIVSRHRTIQFSFP